MTIDEAIAHAREKGHEQIADWLEELKVYQQHEIICRKGYNAGYNKAIDDFINIAKEHDFKHGKKDITNWVEFFAKQLKERRHKL